MKTLIKTIYLLCTFIPFALISGCSALDLINTIAKVHPVKSKKNIAFDSAYPRLNYDLYYPSAPKQAQSSKTPVIVFFYGGSWNSGEKSEYEFVGRSLASKGFIVAVPNYRLYPEVKYPEFLQDGAKAIASILQQLSLPELTDYNPSKKIILMGHSAGGYNAAMLAMDDRWLSEVGLDRHNTVSGLIGLAGAYNIYPIAVPEVKPVFNHPDYPPLSQPIDHTKNARVPTLLLIPETDELVSIERNTLALSKALAQANTHQQVTIIKNTNHITLIGTLSPLLFFKGDSLTPITNFVHQISTPD